MKLLPVLTASAVGSVLAAASLVPAYATAPESNTYVSITVGSEAEPSADTQVSDVPETETVEEPRADEAGSEYSGTPDGAVEVETPDVSTAEVPAPDVTQAESPIEAEVSAPDDTAVQAEVTPIIEPVEIYSAVPAVPSGTAQVEAVEAPSEESVALAATPSSPEPAVDEIPPQSQASTADEVIPQSQQPTAQAAQPSVQESAATAGPPSTQDPVLEAGRSPVIGTGEARGILSVGEELAHAADEDSRDAPPEPRKIDTIDPAEVGEETNSSEPDDNEAQDNEREDQDIRSAEIPADETLPQTGAFSLVLALAGVLLLTAGVVLVTRRRPVVELGSTAGRGKSH